MDTYCVPGSMGDTDDVTVKKDKELDLKEIT